MSSLKSHKAPLGLLVYDFPKREGGKMREIRAVWDGGLVVVEGRAMQRWTRREGKSTAE
jgi:hypothetical protein